MGTGKQFQNSITNVTCIEGSFVLLAAGNKGILDGILTGVAGSASTLISFQNSGGDVLLSLKGDEVHDKLEMNMTFPDGLTIVTSDAGAVDFSVLHR